MSVPGVDVRVEIAWTSGFRTPDVDRVWTDVSEYVELDETLVINYGRSDDLSTADANDLTLTLDNTDGRFTSGNAASPYYPNVKLIRPIRVTAIIDAVEYIRFTGYVNKWPVAWPGGGDTYATAAITASSRLSRLGLDSPLVNLLEQTIAASAPDLYWPITELTGSKVAKEIEGRAPDLRTGTSTPPLLGTGTSGEDEFPLDGRPVVKVGDGTFFIDGVSYSGRLEADLVPPIPFSGSITFGLFIKAINPQPYVSGTDFWGFFPDDSTGATGMAYDRPEYSTHPSELEGVHYLTFTREQTSPTTFTLTNWLDGEIIRTTSGTAAPYTQLIKVFLPAALSATNTPIQYGRFAMWDRVLTPTEIADIADIGLALSGDTTDERLERYADWARIPAAEVITTPSPVQMAAMPREGGQVVTLMRQVETTEAGVLHDDREGRLVLHPRTARYNSAVALTLDTAAQTVGMDYAPKVDPSSIANVGRGTNTLGTIDVTYTDEPSREEYGDVAYNVETAALDDDEPLQLVAWQVNANAQPRPRAPSVTVDVLNFPDADLDDLLALDIGSKTRITNTPSQAPDATADYFTEGYTETFKEASWEMALNLSPVAPYDSVFVLDDATFGELDAGNMIAL